MTRADLINSLGIGRQQLQSTSASGKGTQQDASAVYDTTDEEDDSSEEEGEEEVDEEDDQSDEILDNNKQKQQAQENGNNETLSCKVSDVGGFYAAICALGSGVRVGTKVGIFFLYVICAVKSSLCC